ncbi:MAG: DegV family protein [Candidatus Pacebacteria bacterium]|nr:DegV family protein [Candidatus Paceibacterota bacterium]
MEENKLAIGLVADETVDLPQEIIDDNKIKIVRFKLDLQELADIPGNIYEKAREAERRGLKSLIKTSQPSINDFAIAFKDKLKEVENIICITISSKVSGTYNSALQAKKFLSQELQNKIHIIDTMNGSAGAGLICLKTIEYIKEKLSINEIVERITKELLNFKLLGIYKESKWLEASGRIPKLGSMAINQAEKMNIKPIFGFRDGKLTIVGIKRNIKDLSSALFEEFEKQTQKQREQGKKIVAAITHADNFPQVEKLKEMILKLQNTEVAFINLVCFPIGGHIGPDTIVLAWEQ